jgi:hypothetical protein
MAFQADVTQNIQPSSPSPDTAVRAEQQRASLVTNVLKAGDMAASAYIEQDIKNMTAGARDLREEALISHEVAVNSAREYAANQGAQQTLFDKAQDYGPGDTPAADSVALDSLRKEATRLKDAMDAGMKPEEFATRLRGITRSAIAKYPGLSDKIRAEVERISGLDHADEWASYNYIKNMFATPKKDTSVPTPEEYAKDIAAKGGFVLEDVMKAQQSNPVEYARMTNVAREREKLKATTATIESNLTGERIVSDANARSKIPMIQAMAGVHGQEVFMQLVQNNKGPELQKLLNATTDPAEKLSLMKQNAEAVKSMLLQKKRDSYKVVDDMNAKAGGRISKEVLAELKGSIDEQYKFMEDQFANPQGQLAMLGVLVEHKDKTLEQQLRIASANAAYVQAWGNNTLVQAWMAGGASRESIKRNYPELDSMLSKAEQSATGMNATITNNMRSGQNLSLLTDGANQAEASPTANPNRTKEGDVGAGMQAFSNLETWKKDKQYNTPAVNSVVTAAVHSMNGALFESITKHYPDLQAFMKEIPFEYKAQVMSSGSDEYVKQTTAIMENFRQAQPNILIGVQPGTAQLVQIIPTKQTEGSISGNVVKPLPESTVLTKRILAVARARALFTGESIESAFVDTVAQISGGVVKPFNTPTDTAPATQSVPTTSPTSKWWLE